MTWRKLSRYLMISSALGLAGLWGLSLGYYHACRFCIPPADTMVTLYSGFLGIYCGGDAYASEWDLHILSVPRSETLQSYDGISPMGRFMVKVNPEDHPRDFLHLEVPLWSLWVLFLAVVVLLCRFMEKRTAAGKEKRLAEMEKAG